MEQDSIKPIVWTLASEMELNPDKLLDAFAINGAKRWIHSRARDAKYVLSLIEPNVFDGEKVVGWKLINGETSESVYENLFCQLYRDGIGLFRRDGGTEEEEEEIMSYWFDHIIPNCYTILKFKELIDRVET